MPQTRWFDQETVWSGSAQYIYDRYPKGYVGGAADASPSDLADDDPRIVVAPR
jgi:hypothetical protein